MSKRYYLGVTAFVLIGDSVMNTLKQARDVVGPLGYPSKMPGTAYGISAHKCITGGKLAKVEGSVCHGCYALKANYLYPTVAQAHETRLRGLASPAWVAGMVMMLNHAHATGKGRNGPIATGWHRWHDSGDIQSVAHLGKICEVARQTPHIKHWLPTRELSIVKAYEKAGGVVPENLVIRVSATMVDGPAPKAWPTTSGVHDKLAAQGRSCPAPQQDGRCGDCRACWDGSVKHVSYHLH
jgi:Gene product 88